MVPHRMRESYAGCGLQLKFNVEWDGKLLHGSK